ncbi:MAG: hypothetical protein NTV74_05275 [Euryarchaeota archaeon]|nr:hypothetical protein [Euryarchaeota archaeon]
MKTKIFVVGIIFVLLAVAFSGCQEKSNTSTSREDFSVNENQNVITAANVHVIVEIPAGALTTQTTITVEPATNLPTNSTCVLDTAYTFGPDGLQFQQPVTLSIAYDDGKIPTDIFAESLKLAKLVSGTWQIISDSYVNTTSHTVKGTITGFSTYGLVGNSIRASIAPPMATCPPTGQVVLVAQLYGYPALYQPQYTWTFSGTNGHIVIDPADYSKVTYIARGDATENGVDTISLEVGATFADETHSEGTLYIWATATATVTIKETKVSFSPSPATCLPGGQVALTATVSNAPHYTIEYRWSCTNNNGKMADTASDTVKTYSANENAIEGSVDTVKVELWTTFVENGNTHKWAEATVSITIQKLTMSITPSTAQVPPGGLVSFTAVAKNLPPNYEFVYKWTCTNQHGTTVSGAIDDHIMTYVASETALDGGSDTLKVELWQIVDGQEIYKWAEATATVSIQMLSLDITPLSAECAPSGQVDLTAVAKNLPPDYKFEYRWSCTNNNGRLGSDTAGNTSFVYTADASAVDGSIDTVTVGLWTVFEDANHVKTPYKWAEATATISINSAPLSEYSLCNSEGSTVFIGSGSYWTFYIIGRSGQIDYNSFLACPGDELVIHCKYRGYISEWDNGDVYLKHGESMRLLISNDELPTNQDYDNGEPELQKTFII